MLTAARINLYFTDLPAAHGLRRNPPVTIEDWPDPEDDSATSGDEVADEPVDGPDRDPEYIERNEPLGLNPEDEPAINDDDLRALLEAELGDLADEEWIDMCRDFPPFAVHAF